MGILEILLFLFVILKLLGAITWAWPIVLFPLWIMLGVYGLWFAVFAWITRGR